MSTKYRIIPIGGGGGITPTGTLDIRSEGVFDVTDYASVDVDIFDDTTTKTITNNGTYNASDDHVIGYSQVTVEVPASAVDSGTKSISANGTGIDVVGYAAVDVNVPNGTETITITQDGTYTPTSPNIGFSEVTVNVTGPVYEPDYLCFTAVDSSTQIGMSHYKRLSFPSIEYSMDKNNWNPWDFSPITLQSVGDKLYFRGNNLSGVNGGASEYSNFTSTGRINVSGDISTLVRFDEPISYAIGNAYLFKDCVGLISFEKLPATVLAGGCYLRMFFGCTGLTSLPSGLLPATNLRQQCYQYMFADCTGLTSLPSGLLPATNLAANCYNGMFSGCTGLTSIPADLLPATTIGEYSYYYMFSYCTGLTSIPADLLPATTIGEYGYYRMFYGCSNITESPILPALSPSDQAYREMFYNCASLNKVTCNLNVTPAPTVNWLYGVSQSGTFYKNAQKNNWSRDASGIPAGWTVYDIQ